MNRDLARAILVRILLVYFSWTFASLSRAKSSLTELFVKTALLPLLMLPMVCLVEPVSAAYSRLDGTLPGFHPAFGRCALDPVEDAGEAAADLSLGGLDWLEGQSVLRLGTLGVWAGSGLPLELRGNDGSLLRFVSGEKVFQPGRKAIQAWRITEKGKEPIEAELASMPGAAVVEIWMPRKAVSPSVEYTLHAYSADGTADDLSLSDNQRNTHSAAFLHHGNQGLTWTDVLWGHEPNSHEQHWADYLNTGSTHNGFDELLGLHDVLDLPVNLQIAGPLQTAAEWYYPDEGPVEGWNAWVARGVTEGWAALIASAYAQHIMPFVQDSMNDWSVYTHVQMTEWRYGYTPHVAWVPERVWVSPEDNDGNGTDTSPHVVDWIGDNWLPHGVWGVVLDQEEHCDYENNWSNDRHIYTINVPDQGELKIIPINGSFTGNCHHNAGAAWNEILGTSGDELLLYATDWEVVAEVAGFQDQFPSAVENMIWIAQQIAGSGGSALSVKLDDALGGYPGGPINLQNGTYGLLGGRGGYGSDWLSPGTHNSWYSHWAGSPANSDQHDPQWDYGTVWHNTWTNLMSCPSNDLSETAWYVLMTKMYETGWHDGSEISGWIHRYASHIKNANVYAEASRWVNGDYANTCAAYFSDIDMDGVDEVVLHSDRVFAVFESIGGRAPWIFAKGPGYDASLVGSCSAYWVDTEGDYDDTGSNNHVAAFADVSPNTRNDLYAMSIDSSSNDFASITLSIGELSKTFSLMPDTPWITVDYDTPQETWIQHGFSPDYIDLLWSAGTERVWDPQASWPATGYAGQRNENTGATAALVLGNGGALHSLDFQGTMVRGDEIRGNGRFRYLFYAGLTGEPDSLNGEVAELELLELQDLDAAGPRLESVATFLAPDQVLLQFSEEVALPGAENTANYALSGFPGGVSLLSASRQPDTRLVALQLAGLETGDSGLITVSGVADNNGNPVDPDFDTASFVMPDGLTPHSILVDGSNDFFADTEWMEQSADSLFITWDSQNLYIGFNGQDLSTGDFFVYIDTDLAAASGAPRNAWGRVGFGSAHRPEFELSVEGGGNSMQINSWAGSWSYTQYGDHDGTSYEGWSGNPMSEFRVPWSELGNPAGIAIAASVSQEDNWNTTLSWPLANPTGSDATLTSWYVFDAGTLGQDMPAAGVAPNGSISEQPLAAPVITISTHAAGQLRLDWPAVSGADFYVIYASEQAFDPAPVQVGTTTDLFHVLDIDVPMRWYTVSAERN